ncbi:MAG: zf-TFIIB domain-containing protein [Pseudomonadota bacterium]
MQCPKCAANMEVIMFNDIEIDRCESCHGLWFDHLEQDDLRKLEGAEDIDIGDEFLGARFNQQKDVECPRCHIPMNHVIQSDPFEIKFELCSNCRGTYFDAGEFRDYMEEEIIEQFEAVLAKFSQ